MRISVYNGGPEAASLRVLPTLSIRNTWAWREEESARPRLAGGDMVTAVHPELGECRLYSDGARRLVFTENESK